MKATRFITVCGVDVQIAVEFDASRNHEKELGFDGFDGGVFVDDDLPRCAQWFLKSVHPKRNRRFKKWKRQLIRHVERAVERMKPSDWFEEADCLDAVN